MSNWFDVDKDGLRKLIDDRGKEVVLYELVQNAWDENSTRVAVTLTPVDGKPRAMLTVEDDNPEGFKNLTHAYTLFTPSEKKDDPTLRGRFNLGEKLVLSLCHKAKIISTKGTVIFTEGGKRIRYSQSRDSGTLFAAEIRMTRDELKRAKERFYMLIPPAGVQTTLNSYPLPARDSVGTFEETLQTVRADEEGTLRRTNRQTVVEVYETRPGETAHIYEMGIPVVETGDKYHVNVMQKVPVNMQRDNVPPSYLRKLRTLVLNATFDSLDEEEATSSWVRDAASDPDAKPEAVERTLDLRFGKRRVAYDPTDPEANKRAASDGYTVVPGGSMSRGEWDNAKRFKLTRPAGQVTPSPKPYSPDGKPLDFKDPADYSAAEREVVAFARSFARDVIKREVDVHIANKATWPYRATYGSSGLPPESVHKPPSGRLVLNKGKLGNRFFNLFPRNAWEVIDLLIHEFGHEYESDHLSASYYKALTKIGARAVVAAVGTTAPDWVRMLKVT